MSVHHRYPHHSYCFSEAPGLNEDGSEAKRATEGEDGGPTPFIAVQPFPALLDLPLGSDAVKASCGSRHTAVVTSEWGWVGWFRMVQRSLHRNSLTSSCRKGGRLTNNMPIFCFRHIHSMWKFLARDQTCTTIVTCASPTTMQMLNPQHHMGTS